MVASRALVFRPLVKGNEDSGAVFYAIFARACAEIQIWTSSGFSGFILFIFFRLYFYSFSYLFAAVIDLLLGLLPVQFIIETRNFYHGVAKCSRRKFCCECFTSISEHISCCFEPDHSDLGIIGKIFSSCRT